MEEEKEEIHRNSISWEVQFSIEKGVLRKEVDRLNNVTKHQVVKIEVMKEELIKEKTEYNTVVAYNFKASAVYECNLDF